MDVSPIQRLAISANQAARPVDGVRQPSAAVAPATQARAAAADQQTTQRNTSDSNTKVVVAWHAASLGYVTRIVDEMSGEVVMQTPPEQVLNMVQKMIDRLEGKTT